MSIVDKIKAVIKADDDAIENGGDIFDLERFLKKGKLNYDKFCDEKIPVIIDNFGNYHSPFNKIKKFRAKFHEKYPIFENFDFSNVLIAGGIFSGISFYYANSDVDLFIYGLDEEGSKQKLREIYEYICNQLPNQKIRVYVSKMSFTMLYGRHSKIQVILRRFRSIAHVLNSFDLGSSAIGYDGNNILVSALGLFAWRYLVNVINPRRFSPNYVFRLTKYLNREFAIVLHDVDNEKINDSVKIADCKILVKKRDKNTSLYTAIQTIRLQADNEPIAYEYDDDEIADRKKFNMLEYYNKTGKVFPVIDANYDYDDLFEHKVMSAETITSQYERVMNIMISGEWFTILGRSIGKLFPEIKPNVFLIGLLSLETEEERVAYIKGMINKEVEKLTVVFDVNLPKPEFVYLEENTAITNTPKTAEELFGIQKI